MSTYIPFSLMTLNQNSTSFDGFGRLRSGLPYTIFDSKLTVDNAPLFWDESLVSGAGITSSYLADESAVQFSSTLNTAGRFVRQTFMRFNYQPGKSQRILITGVLNNSGGGVGVTTRLGYYDDNNGIFFQYADGVFGVGIRSSTTGTPVDDVVTQANFNGDKNPEGGGDDELNVDLTKTQIFAIDFEWLGVGRVRVGVIQGGAETTLHYFENANIRNKVYMTTPNLPVRYEMITQATSAASTMKCICSSVISEGGQENNGILRYTSNGVTNVDANVAGTVYAVIGIRLKSTHLESTIKEVKGTLLATTNDNFEWTLRFNPTVAGTFTYADETNSSVQTAKGATANTVTGGLIIDGGYGSSNVQQSAQLVNSIHLGSKIDGTPDTLVLCVRPLTSNCDMFGSITWREL